MAHYSQHIEKQLQQFAPLVGGVDANGHLHYKSEGEQRQHVFWIKNRYMENIAGAFCLGDVIRDKIREGAYHIRYIGPAKDLKKPEYQDKLNALREAQKEDIKLGQLAREERLGIYRSV